MDVPCYRWNYREKGHLFRRYRQRSVSGASFLVIVIKVRIETTIDVVDAEYPVAAVSSFSFYRRRISRRNIQTVIGRHPVRIDPAQFLRQNPINEVESLRQRNGVTRPENKYGRKLPTIVQFISTDDRKIMAAIILARVFHPVV